MRVLATDQTEGAPFYLNSGTTTRWLLISEELPEASSPVVLQWRPDDAGAAWIPLAYELTHGDRSTVVFAPHGGEFRVVPAAAGAAVRFEATTPNVFDSDVRFVVDD